FAAASERTLRYQDIAVLHDGDHFRDGKLFDAQGNEVPVVSSDDHGASSRKTPKTPRAKVTTAVPSSGKASPPIRQRPCPPHRGGHGFIRFALPVPSRRAPKP